MTKAPSLIGSVLGYLASLLAILGLIFYVVNCQSQYFANLGVNPGIIALGILAVVLEATGVGLSRKNGERVLTDGALVVAPALLVVAFVLFLTARVNGMSAILTFNNNAHNMADLSGALWGLGGFLGATIVSVVAAYFPLGKSVKS